MESLLGDKILEFFETARKRAKEVEPLIFRIEAGRSDGSKNKVLILIMCKISFMKSLQETSYISFIAKIQQII